jgi:protein gp37
MNRTKIEWCDFTWNPVTGCRKNCPYCYAARMSKRFSNAWNGFIPTFYPKRLSEPRGAVKSVSIFVSSMGDLFGDWVDESSGEMSSL